MPTFDPTRVTQAFQRLFLTCPLPTAGADPTEALRLFLNECTGYSTEDIEETISQFRAGKVMGQNRSFAPTEPMFADQLRRVSEERHRIDRLNQAARLQLEDRAKAKAFNDGKTAESRARVKAIIEAGVAQLASKAEDKAALDARVKALQEKANDRPEFVADRASPEYRKRIFGVGDQDGRDD